MRFSAFLGGVLAAALSSVSYGLTHQLMAQPTLALPPPAVPGAAYGYRSAGRKAKRHTGAGARGMHRTWQRRRASGRRV